MPNVRPTIVSDITEWLEFMDLPTDDLIQSIVIFYLLLTS